MGFDPLEYWEARHTALAGDHRNVGNRGLSSAENFRRICTKAIRVAHQLGIAGVRPGASLLDAGCGAGVLSGLLADAGFLVTGVDCSATAIAAARERADIDFVCAELSDFRLADARFEAVLCLDVLYHVVDDRLWQRSLANLAEHVAPGGHLLVVEYFADYGKKTAEHVRWRTEKMYAEEMSRLGFEVRPPVSFSYPDDTRIKTLLIMRRT